MSTTNCFVTIIRKGLGCLTWHSQIGRVLNSTSTLGAGTHFISNLQAATVSQPLLSIRSYFNGPNYIDLGALPSRKGLFAELPLVSELLPNRKALTAQFSPHGLSLVPKAILPDAQDSNSEQQEPQGQLTDVDNTMYAVTIKTWRKAKMKKHKIRKRRRANRHKNK